MKNEYKKMKNEYKVIGNEVIMYLNKRNGEVLETVFDLSDLDKVKQFNYRWSPRWRENTQSYYVGSTVYTGMKNGKPTNKNVYLHKYITDTPSDVIVDHIDNDTLNNRRSNLRYLDNQKNLLNRKGANKNSSTGVRNVCYIKADNQYIVQFQINGRNKRMGTFDNLEDAKAFADDKRKKYYKIN